MIGLLSVSAAFHCVDRSLQHTFSLLGTVLRCLMSFDIGRRRCRHLVDLQVAEFSRQGEYFQH